MRKYLEDRKRKRQERRRQDGYDYAAGVLLRSDVVPGHGDETAAEYLREQVDCARTFGRYDEFEEGIESAVARWEKVMR